MQGRRAERVACAAPHLQPAALPPHSPHSILRPRASTDPQAPSQHCAPPAASTRLPKERATTAAEAQRSSSACSTCIVRTLSGDTMPKQSAEPINKLAGDDAPAFLTCIMRTFSGDRMPEPWQSGHVSRPVPRQCVQCVWPRTARSEAACGGPRRGRAGGGRGPAGQEASGTPCFALAPDAPLHQVAPAAQAQAADLDPPCAARKSHRLTFMRSLLASVLRLPRDVTLLPLGLGACGHE